ncbi:MAG: hypothetical protein KC466_01050 [Myxococcales bacterium]|nr:hypothetical protein [Myxococcales bacterium]
MTTPLGDMGASILSRRAFLRGSLAGSMAIALGGLAVPGCATVRPEGMKAPPLAFLTEDEYAIFAAVARRMIPAREGWPAVEETATLTRIDAELARMPGYVQEDFRSALGVMERWLPLVTFRFRSFTAMAPEAQDAYLASLESSSINLFRQLYYAFHTLLFFYYYGDDRTWAPVAYDGPWVERFAIDPIEVDFGDGVKG